MRLIATVREGKVELAPLTRQRLNEWCKTHEGARLVIQDVKLRRSLSQNAYYWAYLGIVESETGQAADDVHEWAKRKFLPPRFITVKGEEIKIPESTQNLDKGAFGEYLDKVAAEIGIPLPNPEDAGYISNYGPLK